MTLHFVWRERYVKLSLKVNQGHEFLNKKNAPFEILVRKNILCQNFHHSFSFNRQNILYQSMRHFLLFFLCCFL